VVMVVVEKKVLMLVLGKWLKCCSSCMTLVTEIMMVPQQRCV
jgi:hypothetical protein